MQHRTLEDLLRGGSASVQAMLGQHSEPQAVASLPGPGSKQLLPGLDHVQGIMPGPSLQLLSNGKVLAHPQKLPRLAGDSSTSSWKQPQQLAQFQGMPHAVALAVSEQQAETSSGSVDEQGAGADTLSPSAASRKRPLAVLQGRPLQCSNSSSLKQHVGLLQLSPQVPAWPHMQPQQPPQQLPGPRQRQPLQPLQPPQLPQLPQLLTHCGPPPHPQQQLSCWQQPPLQPQQPYVRQQVLPDVTRLQVPHGSLLQILPSPLGSLPNSHAGKAAAPRQQILQQPPPHSMLQQQVAVPAPHPSGHIAAPKVSNATGSSQPGIQTVEQLSDGIRHLDQLLVQQQQQQQPGMQDVHQWQSRKDVLDGLALLGQCGIWPVLQLSDHNQLLQQALQSQQQQGFSDSACQLLPQVACDAPQQQQQQQQQQQLYLQQSDKQQQVQHHQQQQVDWLDELLLLQAVHEELNLLTPQQVSMLDELTASILQHERPELQQKEQRLLLDLASDMLQQQVPRQLCSVSQQPRLHGSQQQQQQVLDLIGIQVQLLSQLARQSTAQPQAGFLPHQQQPTGSQHLAQRQQQPRSQSNSTDGLHSDVGLETGSPAHQDMRRQRRQQQQRWQPLLRQQQDRQGSTADSLDEAAAAAAGGDGAVRYTGVYLVR
jgi:hypothetical protein